jgi:hypothetical protein
MARADEALTNPVPLSVSQAAAQVVALINSRASSPHQTEIEAIIARVAPAGEPAPAPHSAELRAARAAVEAVDRESPQYDDELQAADRRFSALTRMAWDAEPRSLSDLQELAVIADHWFRFTDPETRWTHPDQVDDWGDRAVAHLIYAVLTFRGPLSAGGAAQPVEFPLITAELLERWQAYNAAMARYSNVVEDVDGDVSPERKDLDACSALFDETLERLWATPPRTWGDVALRALVYAERQIDNEYIDGRWIHTDPAEARRDGCSNPVGWLRARAFLMDAIWQVADLDPLLPGDVSDPTEWRRIIAKYEARVQRTLATGRP